MSRVALAAVGLGLRDPLGVALLELGRARVVLAARDVAHPLVVLVGGLDELVVLALDVLELLHAPRRELERRATACRCGRCGAPRPGPFGGGSCARACRRPARARRRCSRCSSASECASGRLHHRASLAGQSECVFARCLGRRLRRARRRLHGGLRSARLLPGYTRVIAAALVGAADSAPLGRGGSSDFFGALGVSACRVEDVLELVLELLELAAAREVQPLQIVVAVFLLRPQHVDAADVGADDDVVELRLDVLEARAEHRRCRPTRASVS